MKTHLQRLTKKDHASTRAATLQPLPAHFLANHERHSTPLGFERRSSNMHKGTEIAATSSQTTTTQRPMTEIGHSLEASGPSESGSLSRIPCLRTGNGSSFANRTQFSNSPWVEILCSLVGIMLVQHGLRNRKKLRSIEERVERTSALASRKIFSKPLS